jgi:hypothetical protein
MSGYYRIDVHCKDGTCSLCTDPSTDEGCRVTFLMLESEMDAAHHELRRLPPTLTYDSFRVELDAITSIEEYVGALGLGVT